jgi:hypothetical protein
LLEALLPNLHERTPLAFVAGTERGEVNAFARRRRWRVMKADANLSRAPAPGPFRNEIAGDFGMEAEDEVGRERLRSEVAGGDGAFDAQDPLGEERG